MVDTELNQDLHVTVDPDSNAGLMTKIGPVLLKLRDLAILLLALITLLYVLLPFAGDPAEVLAGMDATPEQLAAIRAKFGLDQPWYVQYATYWWNVFQLDFGVSLASGQPAMEIVLAHLPATLLLASLSMGFTILVSVPLGAFLGFKTERPLPGFFGHFVFNLRRVTEWIVFIFQGMPGFVFGLILIQIFAVSLQVLPSIGYGSIDTWILPTLALSSFLVPKLVRVLATNVTEALREDYIRTARAYGATRLEVLWRHALPNALLGATALIGTQFAFLLSGTVIIERMFTWPGIGWLLIDRTQTLDYPVVQALALLIAVMVFTVNTVTDLSFRYLDPRLRNSTN